MRITEIIEGFLIGVGATRLLELSGFFDLDLKTGTAMSVAIGYFAWGYIMSARYRSEKKERTNC